MERLNEEFIKRCEQHAKDEVEDIRKKVNIKNKKWREENPEKHKASQQFCDIRRRQRKFTAAMILSPQEREEIKRFYRNCPKGYHVDHIRPISKGGNHTIDNLQYLTEKENLQKGNYWCEDENDDYDPDFLLKRLERELESNDDVKIVNIKKA